MNLLHLYVNAWDCVSYACTLYYNNLIEYLYAIYNCYIMYIRMYILLIFINIYMSFFYILVILIIINNMYTSHIISTWLWLLNTFCTATKKYTLLFLVPSFLFQWLSSFQTWIRERRPVAKGRLKSKQRYVIGVPDI